MECRKGWEAGGEQESQKLPPAYAAAASSKWACQSVRQRPSSDTEEQFTRQPQAWSMHSLDRIQQGDGQKTSNQGSGAQTLVTQYM